MSIDRKISIYLFRQSLRIMSTPKLNEREWLCLTSQGVYHTHKCSAYINIINSPSLNKEKRVIGKSKVLKEGKRLCEKCEGAKRDEDAENLSKVYIKPIINRWENERY